MFLFFFTLKYLNVFVYIVYMTELLGKYLGIDLYCANGVIQLKVA